MQSPRHKRDNLQQHDSMHSQRQRQTGGTWGSGSGRSMNARLDSTSERQLHPPFGYTSSKPSQTGSGSHNTSFAGNATATSNCSGMPAAAALETVNSAGSSAMLAVLQRTSTAPPLQNIITSAFSSFSSDAPPELSLPGASACHPSAFQRSQSQVSLHSSTLQQQQKRLRKLQRYASTPAVDGRRPVLPSDDDSRRTSFSGGASATAASAMFALDANYCAADSHASLRFSLGISMGGQEQLFPGLEPGSLLRAAAPQGKMGSPGKPQHQQVSVPKPQASSRSASTPSHVTGMGVAPPPPAIPKHLTIPGFARQSAPQTAWGGWAGEDNTFESTCSADAVALAALVTAGADDDGEGYMENEFSTPIVPPSEQKGGWTSRLWKQPPSKHAAPNSALGGASLTQVPTLYGPSSNKAAVAPPTSNQVLPVQPAAHKKLNSAPKVPASGPAFVGTIASTLQELPAAFRKASGSSPAGGTAPPASTSTPPAQPTAPLRLSFFARLSSLASPHATTLRPPPSPHDSNHPPSLSTAFPYPSSKPSTAGSQRVHPDHISGEFDPHLQNPATLNYSHSRSALAGPVYLPFDHPQHDLLCACASGGTVDGRDSAVKATGGAGTRRNAAVDYSRADPHMDRLSAPTNASNCSSTNLADLDGDRASHPRRQRPSNHRHLRHNHNTGVVRDSFESRDRSARRSRQSEPQVMLSGGKTDREVFSEPLARTHSQSGSLVSSSGAVRRAATPSSESALESMLHECMHHPLAVSPRSSLLFLNPGTENKSSQQRYMTRQNQGVTGVVTASGTDASVKRGTLLHCTTFPHTQSQHKNCSSSSSDEGDLGNGNNRDDSYSMAEGREDGSEDLQFAERPPQSQLQVLPRPLQSARTLTPKKAWWKPWAGKPHTSVTPSPIGAGEAAPPAPASRNAAARATAAMPQGSLDSVVFMGAVQQVRQALQSPGQSLREGGTRSHPPLPTHPRPPLLLRVPLGTGPPPLPHTLPSSRLNHLTTADALKAGKAARQQQGGEDGAGSEANAGLQESGAAKQGRGGRVLSQWISGLPSWGRRRDAK